MGEVELRLDLLPVKLQLLDLPWIGLLLLPRLQFFLRELGRRLLVCGAPVIYYLLPLLQKEFEIVKLVLEDVVYPKRLLPLLLAIFVLSLELLDCGSLLFNFSVSCFDELLLVVELEEINLYLMRDLQYLILLIKPMRH